MDSWMIICCNSKWWQDVVTGKSTAPLSKSCSDLCKAEFKQGSVSEGSLP